MAGGRPTKYSELVLEAAKTYLKSCKDTDKKVDLPTVQGLSAYLKVNQDTLYEWGKLYPEFSEALANIKSEQAKRLINNGLSGSYNPTIAKLILATNHGMSDKTDITSNGKELPQPLMVIEHGLLNNNSDEKDIPDEEKNSGNTGGNVSQQNNLRINIFDSISSNGQK